MILKTKEQILKELDLEVKAGEAKFTLKQTTKQAEMFIKAVPPFLSVLIDIRDQLNLMNEIIAKLDL